MPIKHERLGKENRTGKKQDKNSSDRLAPLALEKKFQTPLTRLSNAGLGQTHEIGTLLQRGEREEGHREAYYLAALVVHRRITIADFTRTTLLKRKREFEE